MGDHLRPRGYFCTIGRVARCGLELCHLRLDPRSDYQLRNDNRRLPEQGGGKRGQTRVRGYSIIRTYLLFAFSLLFFRLPALSDVGYMVSHLSFNIHSSIKELRLGMTDQECIVTGVAVVLLFMYEYFMSKQDLLQKLSQRHKIVRWSVYYLLVLLMFLFGQFGSEDFIYLQF